MSSYGNLFCQALRFGFTPKRWVPFFILDLVFFLCAIGLFISNIGDLFAMLTGITTPVTELMFLTYGMIFIAGVIVWMLIRLLIVGAVLHQAVKPKEFHKSWNVAKNRYLSLLAVTVVIGIISGIVSIVPYIGWLLSIIVSLAFLFSVAAVVLREQGFGDSLKESYRIFRKKPVPVFLVWLGIAIISSIIVLVFAIPGMWIVFGSFIPLFGQGAGELAVPLVFTMLMNNVGWLIVGGVIALIGMAISNAFTLKAQADFYLHMRKGKA